MATVADTARNLRESLPIPDALRRLAPHVHLRKNGAERCAPCPKCGGHDRFYITADGKGCACRQCHTQRMDVAGLAAWLLDVPMHEALDVLNGHAPAKSVSVSTDFQSSKSVSVSADFQPAAWRTDASGRVQEAHARLFGDTETAAAARRYLLSRGLAPDTWRAFLIGYERAKVPGTQDWRPAVCWPVTHETTGETVGIRYRFLETHAGKRYTSLYGSRLSGRLFGAQLLWADRTAVLRCLVITEGEINAMSVYQACNAAGVDVLSFGSESQRTLPAWAVSVAQAYGAVLLWIDDTDKAHELARQVPFGYVLRSVQTDAGKQDANARLLDGTLGGLVQTARLRALRDTSRRESVMWQLWDAWKDGTLDAGQVDVGRRLAQELGRMSSWQDMAVLGAHVEES
jgi:hypothetical protein